MCSACSVLTLDGPAPQRSEQNRHVGSLGLCMQTRRLALRLFSAARIGCSHCVRRNLDGRGTSQSAILDTWRKTLLWHMAVAGWLWAWAWQRVRRDRHPAMGSARTGRRQTITESRSRALARTQIHRLSHTTGGAAVASLTTIVSLSMHTTEGAASIPSRCIHISHASLLTSSDLQPPPLFTS